MNLEKVKVVFVFLDVVRLRLQSTLDLLGVLKAKWQICGKAVLLGIYHRQGNSWKGVQMSIIAKTNYRQPA